MNEEFQAGPIAGPDCVPEQRSRRRTPLIAAELRLYPHEMEFRQTLAQDLLGTFVCRADPNPLVPIQQEEPNGVAYFLMETRLTVEHEVVAPAKQRFHIRYFRRGNLP